MKRLFVLLTLVIMSSPVIAQETTPETWPSADVTQTMAKTIGNGYWIGGVVAWLDGENAAIRAFGTTARSAGSRVNGETIFEIGSISKVFTTAILGTAIAEGKLKLSDTLGALLKNVAKPSPSIARITIEELATHTSGLPRLPTNMKPASNSNPYVDYGREKLFLFLANYELAENARGKMLYSNLGMGLLGTVLEVVLAQDYATLLRERITKPLGMNSTGLSALGKNIAQGHSGNLAIPSWDFAALAGAGDLVSNASDMLKFVGACLDSRESTIGRALFFATETRTSFPQDTNLGLAWHILKKDGRRLIWHNGGTGGFSSFLGFDPKSKRAFFAVVNGNSPTITNLGFHAFFDDVPMGIDRLPKSVTLKSEELAPCVGRYRLKGGLVFEVKQIEEFLFVTIPSQSSLTLYPSAVNEFFLAAAPARCHFIPDKDGKIVALVWSQGGQDQRAMRIGDEIEEFPLSPTMLQKYVGRFRLTKDLTFDIKQVEGHLEAELTNQPSLRIYPISEKKFLYRIIDARITFEFDSEQKVVSLTLFQNDEKKRAPRIL